MNHKLDKWSSMNGDSEYYSNSNEYQTNVYNYLIQLVKPKVKIYDNILDIGSGDGKSTYNFYRTLVDEKQFQGSIVGLDALESMTQYAKNMYCNTPKNLENNNNSMSTDEIQSSPQLVFVNADIGCTDFEKSISRRLSSEDLPIVFDHIISCCCIHWVGDQNTCFQNIKRLLKPSPSMTENNGAKKEATLDFMHGLCVMPALNYATQKIIDEWENPDHIDRLKNLYNANLLPWHRAWMLKQDPIAAYRQFMVNAGFDDEKIVIQELPNHLLHYNFGSMDKLKSFVRGCFPDVFPPGMSEEDKSAFFKTFADYMGEKNKEIDGCPFTMYIPIMHIHYS